MGTLRGFAYDHPNFTVVRQFDTGVADPGTSTVAFAKFRSRVKAVVTAVSIVTTSASSAAKVIFTLARSTAGAAGSANTTFTLTTCSSVGDTNSYGTFSCAVTVDSAGDLLYLTTSEPTGEYHVLYEYQILPDQTLYTRA